MDTQQKNGFWISGGKIKMKIETENMVYNLKDGSSVLLNTEGEGKLVISTKNGIIKISVVNTDRWFKVDMKTGDIMEIIEP